MQYQHGTRLAQPAHDPAAIREYGFGAIAPGDAPTGANTPPMQPGVQGAIPAGTATGALGYCTQVGPM